MPGGRPKGPYKPHACVSASPTVRALFAEAKRQRLKQYWIAERLRITQATLTRWKNGITDPTISECEAFARVLGMRIPEPITENEDEVYASSMCAPVFDIGGVQYTF